VSSDKHGKDKSCIPAYVGLIPAAGVGSRLPLRRLSKELLPFGGRSLARRPVISHLLSCFQRADVSNVIIALRAEKWDIPEYLAGKAWDHFDFTYKITRGTSGVPQTVALGLQAAPGQRIAFGFPDILFEPEDAFSALFQRLDKTNADIVLGLFPTPNPKKMDMVKVDSSGRVIDIEIKPANTGLEMTWILAAWTPIFSKYLCELVQNDSGRIAALSDNSDDYHIGEIIQLAAADGLKINSVSFQHGRSLDIGTPADLDRALSWSR